MTSNIQAIEAATGLHLPASYRDFLLRNQELLLDHLVLYGPESVIERNLTNEVFTYCPGYLEIGNDNGCGALLIRLGVEPAPVVRVDTGVMSPDAFEPIAPDLALWLASECPLPAERYPDHPSHIDLYLLRVPSDGLIGLRRIQDAIGLFIPVIELRSVLANVPYRLVRSAPYLPLVPLAFRANELDNCLGWFTVDDPKTPVSLEPWPWSTSGA